MLALDHTLRVMSSQRLSEQEQRGLCDVLYWAFLDLRGMSSPDRAFQASKLAYALHNLPHLIFADDFVWEKVEGRCVITKASFIRRRPRVVSITLR